MSDPWDEVEASLRRQFEPPTLDGLNERIALAAAERERDAAALGPVAATTVVKGPSRPRWSVAGAFAVAAAAVLLVLLPRDSPPDDSASLSPVEAESDSMMATTVATTVAARVHAGRQLDDFLRAEATLPTLEQACMVTEFPPTWADDPGPELAPASGLDVRGECGGRTGIDCAAHALPAQRALLVRLPQTTVDVIVCIEPPEADPKPVLPRASGYSIFRQTLGKYVLYEITPLAEPMVLDHLTVL